MKSVNGQRSAVPLLVISIIFLLMAQYVVNEAPWQHIFRIVALIVLAGGAVLLLANYRRGKSLDSGEKR